MKLINFKNSMRKKFRIVNNPRLFCPFCRERVVYFEENKEVTPAELYELLKHNYNKIVLI